MNGGLQLLLIMDTFLQFITLWVNTKEKKIKVKGKKL